MKRNSSIELLKIIALFIITISHTLPWGEQIQMGLASTSFSNIIFNIFVHFGYIGNVIFIVCSSYFLLDSKRAKAKKVSLMIINTFIVSLFLLFLTRINNPLSIIESVKFIFPLTFTKYWFISCYLIFYIIHPYLNKVIFSLNKKGLFRVVIFLFVIYSILQVLVPNAYYFNNFIGFIIIYLYVAYCKKYLEKFSNDVKLNVRILIVSFLLLVGGILALNFIGLKITKLNAILGYFLFNLANPFYIFIAISLLNIFKRFTFYNKFINYFSSCSLFYYMISPILFNIFFRKYYYDYIIVKSFKVMYVLLISLITFVVSAVIAISYKLIFSHFVEKINDKMYKVFKNVYLRIENKLLKIS